MAGIVLLTVGGVTWRSSLLPVESDVPSRGRNCGRREGGVRVVPVGGKYSGPNDVERRAPGLISTLELGGDARMRFRWLENRRRGSVVA